MLTTSSAGAARIALTAVLVFSAVVFQLSAACNDYDCYGVNVCSSEGECVEPTDCMKASNIQNKELNIQIRGPKCRVTFEAIHQALPEYVTKDGDEYTLKKKLIVRDGCVLEIHGASAASSSDAAVSVLKLKSDESGYAPIIAHHGKISIIDTAVMSYDESLDGPDERLEDRAYIAALSSESDDQTKVWESRMDVHNSEISYLGIEGDYHNDVNETFGLLWKVMGYDDRYPGDLELFDRVGVYGSLTDSKIHHNYIGAYCYGMKGSSVWSGNEIYSNSLVGINPQDNSDDMTLTGNHVHDNGWHGIEYSKRCEGALVYDNIVEDNGRAGIFFHRSTDYADAYNNTARRNAEGDFGIFECTGVTIHDNIMEGGRYGVRISMGAQECDVYNNVMSDSTRYGVFFYRGSDEPEASIDWNGRPRFNIIRDNDISDPVEGQGVAVTGSDYNEILDNVFVGIDQLRFDNATETFVLGNVLPDGVSFNLDEGATLAEGSQEPTD